MSRVAGCVYRYGIRRDAALDADDRIFYDMERCQIWANDNSRPRFTMRRYLPYRVAVYYAIGVIEYQTTVSRRTLCDDVIYFVSPHNLNSGKQKKENVTTSPCLPPRNS